MQGQTGTPQQATSLDNLLQRLDEQVSTYYNLLNSLGSVTSDLHSDELSPATNQVQAAAPKPYNPGKLYRFDEIIATLANQNTRLEIELKKLQQHV